MKNTNNLIVQSKTKSDVMNQKKKNVALYDKTFTTLNARGQVMEKHEEHLSKISEEPAFIKLYYETMLSFNQSTRIPVNFILSVSRYITWSDEDRPGMIRFDRCNKDQMMVDCGVKQAQIERYIHFGIEDGIFFKTDYRGVYNVNPFFIARGKWADIRKLQAHFDFIEGKWTRTGELETPHDEEQEIGEVVNG